MSEKIKPLNVMKYTTLKDGSIRYSNMRIKSIPSEKFPEMVQITKGPSRLKSLIGKKYISMKKAILAIDEAVALSMIGGQRSRARIEMAENGIVSVTEL